MSLLKQDLSHVVGAIFTKLLVQFGATDRGGVAFYFDHIPLDLLGFTAKANS